MVTQDELRILENGYSVWMANTLLWSRAFKWYNENHEPNEQLLKRFTQTPEKDFVKVYEWCVDRYRVKLPRPIK